MYVVAERSKYTAISISSQLQEEKNCKILHRYKKMFSVPIGFKSYTNFVTYNINLISEKKKLNSKNMKNLDFLLFRIKIKKVINRIEMI